MTNRPEIVATCPEGWQSTFQPGELLPQPSGCIAFKLLDDIVWAVDGGGFDKQMHLVRHKSHRFDGHADFICLFNQQFSQPDLNRSISILRRYLGRQMRWQLRL